MSLGTEPKRATAAAAHHVTLSVAAPIAILGLADAPPAAVQFLDTKHNEQFLDRWVPDDDVH